ncbi:hypothetical protein BDY19DRAFT_73491 [Irpex rosettiformis]|uniref:Uncharacterized protein n=1 Tax=Irpex rosettiformis TaxID=378272 RepID=A0ACB8ULD9_9APHY|nr:hypothetical protein BDY19DRAFT_73491 [Irpex rosettiformis]
MTGVTITEDLGLPDVNALIIGKRFRTAAIALLVYDHLISLDREIELVWRKRKAHPVFFLYVFNRFFVLAYYIFDSVPLTYNGIVSTKICVFYLMLDVIVTTVTTLVVQVLLQLRIYALYDRSRKVLLVLLVLCVFEATGMGILVALTMKHLFRTNIPDTSVGCAYQNLPKISFFFFIPSLLYEPILCCMVAYKAISSTVRIPLINRIARDSMIYFIAIFAELLVSTLVWAKAPGWMNIVNPWSAALPSLLGSRLILSMREAVERQNNIATYIVEEFPSVVYARDVDHLGSESDDLKTLRNPQ